MYLARKIVPNSLWRISTRDSLKRLVFEYKIPKKQCETDLTPEELVSYAFAEVKKTVLKAISDIEGE